MSFSADASLRRNVPLPGVNDESGPPFQPLNSDPFAPDPFLGTVVDGVTLVRRIGEGGFGIVYEGRQRVSPHVVAVKVIRPQVVTPGIIRRFAYEAETLARLDHPGITRFLRLARTTFHDLEVPCLVMELVPAAKPITKYAGDLAIPTRERIGLVLEAADAIAHAHQHGILHRDLKPGNILVGTDGHAKIIDFGWARGHDSAAALQSAHTQFDQLVGTPQYMSPEQLEGDPAAVDLRSDVYALGAVLQEILTGTPPHTFASGPFFHFANRVKHEPPAPLPVDDPDIDRQLRTIVARCLAKDRHRRYSSATELAADLRRHLAGEPIAPATESLFDTLGYLARKHAVVATSIALTALALMAAAAMSTFYFLRSEAALTRERATAADLREESSRAKIEASRAERETVNARRQLSVANLYRLAAAIDSANITAAENLFDETSRLVAPIGSGAATDLPIELRILRARLQQPIAAVSTGTPDLPAADVTAVALDTSGARVATASADGLVRLWHTATGALEQTIPHPAPIVGITFAAGDTRLAARLTDGSSILWDASTGTTVERAETNALPVTPETIGSKGTSLTSPDGSRLAVAGPGSELRLVDQATGTTLARLTGHATRVATLAFSPDGAILASVPQKGPPILWRGSDGVQIAVLEGHDASVTAIAFAPDSATLATASGDRTVRVWETADGAPLRTLRGHHDRVDSIAWSADGRRLVSGSSDGLTLLWDTTSKRGPATLEDHPEGTDGIAFLPGSNRLVSWSRDGTARLWDPDTATLVAPLPRRREPIRTLAVSPDGSTVAIGGDDDLVLLHDTRDGRETHRLRGHARRVTDLAFSADGRLLASASGDGTVRLWDPRAGTCSSTLNGHDGDVLAVAISPDGLRVASASADGTARIWSVADAAEPMRLTGHAARVRTLAFDPSGTFLATGSDDGTARLWRLADGTSAATLRGGTAPVTKVLFDPGGTRLFTGSMRGGGDLWDTASGTRLARLAGHTAEIRGLVVSPDGSRLATASSDGTARLWDAADGTALVVLRGHTGPVNGLAFSPDGRDLATASSDGTVRLWTRSDNEVSATRRRRSPAPVHP